MSTKCHAWVLSRILYLAILFFRSILLRQFSCYLWIVDSPFYFCLRNDQAGFATSASREKFAFALYCSNVNLFLKLSLFPHSELRTYVQLAMLFTSQSAKMYLDSQTCMGLFSYASALVKACVHTLLLEYLLGEFYSQIIVGLAHMICLRIALNLRAALPY